MFVIIVCLGRREYARILRLAVWPWSSAPRGVAEPALQGAVWACRLYLLASAALMALLLAGLDWLMALLLVAAFSMMVTIVARVTAEIGIPWLTNFSGAARLVPLRILQGVPG
jgi:hypothetical protein